MAKSKLIGDYIYYNYSHYLRNGLKIVKNNPSEEYTDEKIARQAYIEQKKKLSKEINNRSKKFSDKDLTDIEETLNYYYTPGTVISDNNDAAQKKEIQQFIEQQLGLAAGDINWKNLDVRTNTPSKMVDDLSEDIKTAINGLKKLTDKKRNSKTEKKLINNKNLYTTFEKIITIRGKILNENNVDIFEAVELKKVWDRLCTEVRNTNSKFYKSGRNTMEESMVQDINTLIKATKINSGTIKGQVAELFLFANQYVRASGQATGIIKADELVKEFLVTKVKSTKSHKGLFQAFFNKTYVDLEKMEIDHRKLSNELVYDGRDDNVGLFTCLPTEDKVDLIWTYDDNKTANLSIKNYNLATKDHIHILSGRSLISLIQEYTVFINHFLNVFPERDKWAQQPTTKIRDSMKQTILLTALMKALTGGVFAKERGTNRIIRTQYAELFVVNDSSVKNPKFQVYDMSNIYKNIANDVSKIKTNLTTDLDTLTNTWIDDRNAYDWKKGYERTRKMVQQLHALKLSISIHKNSLK